jgi:general secretion pathway protein A
MYRAHFGFRRKPFELTPDPRFLFMSSVHREAFAALKYGIWQHRGLIRLVGDVGSGKSTLVRALLEDLDVSVKTVWINHTTLDTDEFLTMVVRDLELEPRTRNRLDLLQQIHEFLLGQAAAGKPSPVFLIDEAQNLSDEVLEEIRLLSNLETDDRKLAQIVLAGQPELEKRLERPNLRNLAQRIAVRAWLTPLGPDETADYVRHRIHIAGCENPHLFSPDALRAIWDETGGLPRLINLLSEQCLIYAFGAGQLGIEAPLVREAAKDLKLSLAGSEEAKQRARGGIDEARATTPDEALVPPPPRLMPISGSDQGRLLQRQGLAIYALYAVVFVATLFVPFNESAGIIPAILRTALAIGLLALPFYLRLVSFPKPHRNRLWINDSIVGNSSVRTRSDSGIRSRL